MAKLLIPDEATPRLYGRLTVLIAGALLACGSWGAGGYLAAPMLRPVQGWGDAWFGRAQEDAMIDALDRLTGLRAVETVPSDIEKTDRQIALVLRQPKATIATIFAGFGGADVPAVRLFGIVDTIAGLTLNVALIVGAAGLIGLREWGRKLVVIVAGLKLAKLALFAVLMLSWILPIQMRVMREHLGPPVNIQRPGIAPGSMTSSEMLAAIATGGKIGWALLAAIYPALLLVMLTKPRVRAACRAFSFPDPDFSA